MIVKKYFNMAVDDTQCGFKFISYNQISTIEENLTVGNFAYDIDLPRKIEEARQSSKDLVRTKFRNFVTFVTFRVSKCLFAVIP